MGEAAAAAAEMKKNVYNMKHIPFKKTNTPNSG